MQGGGGQHDRHGGLRFPVVPTIGPIRNDRRGTIKRQLLRQQWGASRKERAMQLQLDENGPLHSQLTRALQTRSDEHTSELQSIMRISHAVFCLKTKTQ